MEVPVTTTATYAPQLTEFIGHAMARAEMISPPELTRWSMSALPTQTYLEEDPFVGGAVSIPSLSSGRRLECSKSCFLRGLRRLNDNISPV